MFGGGSVVPLVQVGQAARARGERARKRSPTLPELPTIGETYPGYAVTIWQGLFAPTGTPPEIVDQAAHRDPCGARRCRRSAQKLINAGSGEPSLISVEEFSAMIADDYVRYGKIIKDTGIKVDN